MWSVVRSRRGSIVEVDIVDETPSTFISVFGDLFIQMLNLRTVPLLESILILHISSALGPNTLYMPAIHTRRVSLLC